MGQPMAAIYLSKKNDRQKDKTAVVQRLISEF